MAADRAPAGLFDLFCPRDRDARYSDDDPDDDRPREERRCFRCLHPEPPPTGYLITSIPVELDEDNPFAQADERDAGTRSRGDAEKKSEGEKGRGAEGATKDAKPRDDKQPRAVPPAPAAKEACTLDEVCAQQKETAKRLAALEKQLKELAVEVGKLKK